MAQLSQVSLGRTDVLSVGLHAVDPNHDNHARPRILRLPSEAPLILISDELEGLYERVRTRIAPAEIPLLIQGDTGTGKELLARASHDWSPRCGGPFIALNCAAVPESLAEAELFGHGRGAYSGAEQERPGLVEAAHGGTLFLDEVAELPLPVQAKLLRVLESRTLRRLGETEERPADVRLVAATHRPLEEEIRAGRFRRDLYYRLKGAAVALPSLKRSGASIPKVAEALLAERAARTGRSPPIISADLALGLARHSWPGNIRELLAFVDYALAGPPELELSRALLDEWLAVPGERRSLVPPPRAVAAFRPIAEEIAELERTRMAAALAATGGQRAKAAALISMPLRTFGAKLKLYGLDARGPRD